jgi:hypothetical protein
MVNFNLFIELIRAASAADVADHIKGMSLANCKFCVDRPTRLRP